MEPTQTTESAAKPDTSPVNIPSKPCPICGKVPTAYVGPGGIGFYQTDGKCIVCWVTEVGDRIEWTACPKCAKEWSKLTEAGICYDCAEETEKAVQKEKRMFARLKKLMGSEKSVKELTLENFNPVEGTEAAYLAAKSFNPATDNLYFWGATGRGKTHLAYAIAQKYLRAGLTVDVLSVRDFVNRFRLLRPENEAEEVRILTRVDVLVIDDFGVVRSSDFSMDILLDVLNKRFLQDKNGLVVTSNLSFEDIARKNNDDRITSRLNGACKAIKFIGDEDWRMARKDSGADRVAGD